MTNPDYECAGCRAELQPGDIVILILSCEHFVHFSCAKVASGRCGIDGQLLDLLALQSLPKFTFSAECMSHDRLERLMASNYLSDSCRNIGWIYRFMFENHNEQAKKWFDQALDLNNENANALLDLAECYNTGVGAEHNFEKAADLRNKAMPLVEKLEANNRSFLGDDFADASDQREIPSSESASGDADTDDHVAESESEYLASSEDTSKKSNDERNVDNGSSFNQIQDSVSEVALNRIADQHCSSELEEEHTPFAVADQNVPVELSPNTGRANNHTCSFIPEEQRVVSSSASSDIPSRNFSHQEEPTTNPSDAIEELIGELIGERELNAPNISGYRLKFFTKLLKIPVLGSPFCSSILKDSGFIDFRRRATHSADAKVRRCTYPIYYPLPFRAEPISPVQVDWLFHALDTGGSALKRTRGSVRPTIRDYHMAYSSQATTPSETAQVLLDIIDKSNQPYFCINAVICREPSTVLAEAAASTMRWSEGAPLSVLDGVPFTVKDSLDVAGYITGCASNVLTGLKPQKMDADVVWALRKFGMMMIGKCNQDELGIGVRGLSSKTGPTRNPYNTQYVSGGSSGGCAASVAAGLCPVSLASGSTGGIRIPAACCGVFGLKSCFSRISTAGRVFTNRDSRVDAVSSLLHVGPITGCAEDLVLMYHVLAGFAPHRQIPNETRYWIPAEAISSSIERSIVDLRVGVCEPWLQSCEGDALHTTRYALHRMFECGAKHVGITIPDLEDIRVASSISVITELLRDLESAGVTNVASIGDEAAAKMQIGKLLTPKDNDSCNVVRAKAMDYCVREIFGKKAVDVLVTPALGIDTPRLPKHVTKGSLDVTVESKMMKTMNYANYTGIPACVIPVLRSTKTGLPSCIQVMSAPWNERKLLQVCFWAEQEFKLKEVMKPVHCYDALSKTE